MIREAVTHDDNNEMLDDDIAELIYQFEDETKECVRFSDINESGMLALKMIRKLANVGDYIKFIEWNNKRWSFDKPFNDVSHNSLLAAFFEANEHITDNDNQMFEKLNKLFGELKSQFETHKQAKKICNISMKIIDIIHQRFGNIYHTDLLNASFAYHCSNMRHFSPSNAEIVPLFVKTVILYSTNENHAELLYRVRRFIDDINLDADED